MDNRSSIHSTSLFFFCRYDYLRRLGFILFLCHAALVHGQNQGITMDVDDTDPRIVYDSESGWALTSADGAFDGTEHLNRVQGGTASFTFTGIGISVFGTIVPQSMFGGNITKSTYFLDSNPGQSFTVSANVTEMSFGVLFFQSLNLLNGTHTLMIVNENQDDWYLLDFLQVLSPDSSQSSGSSNNVSSPQPVSQGNTLPSSASVSNTSFGSSTMSSSSSMTATKSSSSSSTMSTSTNDGDPVSLASHSQPISPGAAVGIAFSGAVILAIGAALIVLICHRYRRRNTDLARLTAIDPFVEGFLAATHEPKGEFSPPVSPAAAETSAHGMFYPYVVEFFSRSRGPRSFKSIISPSRKSARSAKLNVSPMTQSDLSSPRRVPPLPTTTAAASSTQPPVLRLSTQRPVSTATTPKRKSTRRSTKFSFLNNLGLGEREEVSSPISSTEVQMGFAL